MSQKTLTIALRDELQAIVEEFHTACESDNPDGQLFDALSLRIDALEELLSSQGANTMPDDHEWTACTLGFFVQLLIDTGHDPAVIFRTVEDFEPDENGAFIRRLEVLMIPDGQVQRAIHATGAERIHKTLFALLREEAVS